MGGLQLLWTSRPCMSPFKFVTSDVHICTNVYAIETYIVIQRMYILIMFYEVWNLGRNVGIESQILGCFHMIQSQKCSLQFCPPPPVTCACCRDIFTGCSPVDSTDLRQPYDVVSWTRSSCTVFNCIVHQILYDCDDVISLLNSFKFWTLTIVLP